VPFSSSFAKLFATISHPPFTTFQCSYVTVYVTACELIPPLTPCLGFAASACCIARSRRFRLWAFGHFDSLRQGQRSQKTFPNPKITIRDAQAQNPRRQLSGTLPEALLALAGHHHPRGHNHFASPGKLVAPTSASAAPGAAPTSVMATGTAASLPPSASPAIIRHRGHK
jgi:hypothetical protein